MSLVASFLVLGGPVSDDLSKHGGLRHQLTPDIGTSSHVHQTSSYGGNEREVKHQCVARTHLLLELDTVDFHEIGRIVLRVLH